MVRGSRGVCVLCIRGDQRGGCWRGWMDARAAAERAFNVVCGGSESGGLVWRAGLLAGRTTAS